VTYTNTGQVPYSGIRVAFAGTDFTDDVVTNGDRTASSGRLTTSSQGTVWTGDIPVGGTVTVTGSATVHNPDTGNLQIITKMSTTAPGSNCPAGATDPRCTISIPVLVPGLDITTVADTSAAQPGQNVGYTVTLAANATAGLAELTNVSPDLIITDLDLPDLNGLDLIQYVRRHEDGQHIPVIVVSASTGGFQSAKALEAHESATMERCYFSFADMLKFNDLGYFPYTPSTPMLHGLQCSLDLLFAEGLPQVFARHHRLAEGIRRGVEALGLSMCAVSPQWYSDTVTAIRTPEGVDAAEVCRIGYHRYRTSFGAGLAKVAGKVFRIGHLGDLNEVMCLAALASAEMSLADAGAKVELINQNTTTENDYCKGNC